MRFIIPVVFLLLVAGGCKKKQHCYARTYQLPAYLHFAGFDTSSLDTIYVQHYEPDGAFSQLSKTDSIYTTGMRLQHDTCVNVFAGVSPGTDYKVIIPATGKSFLLTKITGGPPDSMMDMGTSSHCSSYGGFFFAPTSLAVDGIQVATTRDINGPASYLYLHQ
ncbi:hypothetical protein ACTHGU_21235 [Chitinophagaceae bacterium MMS25-I14]